MNTPLVDRNPAKPTTDDVPAVILGSGITALAVVRQLGRLGITCHVAADDPALVRGSRWTGRLMTAPPATNPPAEIEEWIEGLDLDRAVLIPCSDDWVRTVATIASSGSGRFQTSIPPLETVETLVDKGRFAAHLRREGVPHPETRIIESLSDLDKVNGGLLGRGFLKPRDSQSFYRTFHAKALRVDGPCEARSRIRDVLNEGLGVVVQELVPGPTECQYCIDGFVDRHGDIKGLFARRWLRKYPADFGESSLAVSVALEELPEAVELARRTVKSLDYRGVFSVELKVNADTRKTQVLEVNARPWWYVGFTCDAGVNVCRMLYRDALERPVSEESDYEVGLKMAYPYYDWHAIKSLPLSDRPSPGELLATWIRAVNPIFAWDDPGPSLVSLIDRGRSRLPGAVS